MQNTMQAANLLMQEAISTAGFHLLQSRAEGGMFETGGVKFAWKNELNESDGTVRAVTVWCSVGTLEAQENAELLERVLEMNLFGTEVRGGHLGLYAPTRALVYSYRLKPWEEDRETTAATLTAYTESAAGIMFEIREKAASAAQNVPLFGSSMLWV